MVVGNAPGMPVAYQHDFYVAELYATGLNPDNFWINSEYRGNKFYLKEATGFGKAATGFGVIAGVAAISAASASLQHSGNSQAQ